MIKKTSIQTSCFETITPVSVHGGHSGSFCNHAKDTLEAMIQRYIELKFPWVGITEHLYPPTDGLCYPDEIKAGLNVPLLQKRFQDYIETCRALQEKYTDQIEILVAFETETYSGYGPHVTKAIERYQPDYIVGSVHHVDDLCIDFSPEHYHAAADALGGIHALYARYFDQQYEMIETLSPAVVGHFDLIRIFDDDYPETLKHPEIEQRIIRNLTLIKAKDLILDFNLRALKKGAKEPYVSRPILKQAQQMGIKVVPGDDSHGVSDIGINMAKGIEILKAMGFETAEWPKPTIYCAVTTLF